MDLKDLRDNLIPQGIHELRAGLNPKDLYLVQPRRWTQWLLRGIFGVALALGALVVIGAYVGR